METVINGHSAWAVLQPAEVPECLLQLAAMLKADVARPTEASVWMNTKTGELKINLKLEKI